MLEDMKSLNRLSKITLIIGGISLLTAIIHKLLFINTYKDLTLIVIIPFIIFFLLIIINFISMILSFMFKYTKNNFKQIFISISFWAIL